MPSKEVYQKKPDYWREYNARYRKEHPALQIRARQYVAKWYQEHKEERKEYLKEYSKGYRAKHTKGERKGRGNVCEVCGETTPCLLNVHHIIPRSIGGDDTMENKITVCVNCHRMIHRGKILLLKKGKLKKGVVK